MGIDRGAVSYRRRERVGAEVVGELRSCGVAAVVQAMGPVMVAPFAMSEGIARRKGRGCVAGSVVRAACPLADNVTMHAGLRFGEAGDVIAMAAKGSVGALWGELAGRAAAARGVVGAVIDGGVRDGDALEELGFPVWATRWSPFGCSESSGGMGQLRRILRRCKGYSGRRGGGRRGRSCCGGDCFGLRDWCSREGGGTG